MELPSHPEAEDTTPCHRPSTNDNRAAIVIAMIVGALIVLIVALHLAGVVGPGAH